MNEKKVQPKTILIVEDDEDISDFIAIAIASETPYQTVQVGDGFHAHQWIKSHTPALILLDYRLPGMNGLELYDSLSAKKALLSIPIVMMSANAPDAEIKKRNLPLLRKPFELDELLNALTMMLETPVSIVHYRTESMKRA